MNVRAELESLVVEGDWRALAGRLGRLDDAELKVARAWYRAGGRATARRLATHATTPDHPGSHVIVMGLLAAALPATPADALRAFEWRKVSWWSSTVVGLPAVAETLARRGRDWCAEFVTLAGGLPQGDFRFAREEVTTWCMVLVSHFDLPIPEGPTYAWGWPALVDGLLHVDDPEVRCPGPLRLVDGVATPVTAPPDIGPFAALFACMPRLADSLRLVLATPDAAMRLVNAGKGLDLGEALRGVVDSGVVPRASLVGWLLAALTRSDAVGAQRAVAELLAIIGLAPEDLRDHIGLALGVLSTAHGSATAVVVPALARAGLEPDDLRDLAGIILSRKEKRQKVLLVEALGSLDATLDGAVTDVLHEVARLGDRSLVAMGQKLLAARGVEAQSGSDEPEAGPGPGSLWLLPADTGRPPDPFEPVEASPAGLRELASRQQHQMRVTDNALWLDVVARLGVGGPDVVREVLLALGDVELPGRSAFDALTCWARTGALGLSAWTRMDPAHDYFLQVGPPEYHDLRRQVVLASAITELLAGETIGRLGTMRGLLSTPDRDNGTLSVEGFIANARAAGATSCGIYDLYQALLRIGPMTEADLAAVEMVDLGPLWHPADTDQTDDADDPHGTDAQGADAAAGATRPDGNDLVRSWAAQGGLPPRGAVEGRPGYAVPAVVLPRLFESHPVLDGVGLAISTLDHGGQLHVPPTYFDGRGVAVRLGVLPHWPDDAVALLTQGGNQPSRSVRAAMSWLLDAAALGVGGLRFIVSQADSTDVATRSAVAQTLVTLHGQGRLEPALLLKETVQRHDDTALSLARTADTWEQAIIGGAMVSVWPAVLAVAADACGAVRKPAGLAELLRMMARYVSAVPPAGPVLPASLVALAEAKGSTKAHLEAREVVAQDARRQGTSRQGTSRQGAREASP